MAENLAYEGAGQQIIDNGAWSNINYNGWCYYDNDKATYGSTYGVLYQWEVAKEACPSGWHLPSFAEWTTLTSFLGGDGVAGGKMKETGITHWESPNTGATNESGFTALPGGARDGGGTFGGIGNNSYWWSSTERSFDNAFFWYLFYNEAWLFYHSYTNCKRYGLSVRCVRDY